MRYPSAAARHSEAICRSWWTLSRWVDYERNMAYFRKAARLNMTTYDGTSLPTYGAQRPNIVGTPKRNHGHDWINNYFTNPGVFVLPPLYAIGNAPRSLGTVRTPYLFDADLSVIEDVLSGSHA